VNELWSIEKPDPGFTFMWRARGRPRLERRSGPENSGSRGSPGTVMA